MDETLVAFLVKALDDDEMLDVEERVKREPELHERLDVLKKSFAPLALDAEAPEPPARLVLNTLARVAEAQCQRPDSIVMQPRPVLTVADAPTRRWFRRVDVLVAAALLMVVSALAFPWIVRRWHEYQIVACQNNLKVFWNALQIHGDNHEGAFPQLQEEGPCSFAGIVVPILNQEKYLAHEVSVLCPAVGKRPPDERSVRDLKVLWERDGPNEFRAVMRDVGGSYAYPLGYLDGANVVGLSRTENDGVPIMADAPGAAVAVANSANHGGTGQNVLFIGGVVRWCTTRTVGPDGDDIYVNRNNEVAAGLNRDDVVLGTGDACTKPSSCMP